MSVRDEIYKNKGFIITLIALISVTLCTLVQIPISDYLLATWSMTIAYYLGRQS